MNQVHAHNYYPHFLVRNEVHVTLRNTVPNPGALGEGVATKKLEYSHDLFTQEALDFIDLHRNIPFFLYLPYTIPHVNTEADSMEVPDLGIYANKNWPDPEKQKASAIGRLDHDISRIIRRLRDYNIDDRTVVFFTSDNGPHGAGGVNPVFSKGSGPLRGMKGDLYEGGIRVPMIVRWPGKIPPNTVSGHVGYFADILPTLAHLANVDPPEAIDGVSFQPTLVGRHYEQKKHEYLYWEFYGASGGRAARMGDWKAVQKPFSSRMELYNLESDLGEVNDVADQRPDVVEEITSVMEKAHTPSPNWTVESAPDLMSKFRRRVCEWQSFQPVCLWVFPKAAGG
jgi:arylsulfatase A-like enzyme